MNPPFLYVLNDDDGGTVDEWTRLGSLTDRRFPEVRKDNMFTIDSCSYCCTSVHLRPCCRNPLSPGGGVPRIPLVRL